MIRKAIILARAENRTYGTSELAYARARTDIWLKGLSSYWRVVATLAHIRTLRPTV